jgi:hypothetical protein
MRIEADRPRRRRLAMTTQPSLEQLDILVGTWTTEATHPALAGVAVHGTVVMNGWKVNAS